MKKARKLSILFSILIVTGMLFVLAGCGSGSGDGSGTIGVNCIDVSGTWSIKDVNDASDCGGGEITEFSTITITQDGCNLTIVDDEDTSNQTISGSTVNFTSSWEEDGGTVNSTGSITFSGDTVSGTQDWTWSDGDDQCSGTMTITGTKQ